MSGKKLGLALGGGAARGLAHIGVLKALDAAGIKPDFIAGTSIGAIIGGIYACGYPLKQIEDMAKSVRSRAFLTLFRPAFRHDGFVESAKMDKFFETVFKDRDISSLPVPFRAVATDFLSGRKQAFTKGSLFLAMRASSSIPVLFTPTAIDGRSYIDGGFTDPIPVSTVREMGAEVILAVNVIPELAAAFKNMHESRTTRRHASLPVNPAIKPITAGFSGLPFAHAEKGLPGVLDISLHTRDIIEYNLMEFDLEINKPDFLLEPNTGGYVGWFDFQRLEELIQNGVRVTEKIIPELKVKLAG